MLHSILMFVHFACALAIIGLVLLQRGRGADAGAGFGAGASGTVFGARGATTALSRATAVLAAIFMVTSLSLAYIGNRTTTAAPGSLLDKITTETAPASTSAPITAPASGGATLVEPEASTPAPTPSGS